METTAGIRDLKARLSHYLRRVKAGETVIITEHGRPVAQIVPCEETTEERLLRMKASGLIAWSGEPLAALEPVAKTRGEKTVSQLLLENRD